jgi:hypothetical protein
MAPGTHHRQIDAQHAALCNGDDDVHIATLAAVDILFVLHLPQGLDLIATDRRLFERQTFCRLIHGCRQAPDDVLLAALQEHRRHLDVCGIALRRYQADAGPRTALDLIEQAGP